MNNNHSATITNFTDFLLEMSTKNSDKDELAKRCMS